MTLDGQKGRNSATKGEHKRAEHKFLLELVWAAIVRISRTLGKRLVIADVRFWPLADIRRCAAHVRFRGQSRHDLVWMSAFAVAIGGKADMTYCTAYVR
jgi:hypothetical protein